MTIPLHIKITYQPKTMSTTKSTNYICGNLELADQRAAGFDVGETIQRLRALRVPLIEMNYKHPAALCARAAILLQEQEDKLANLEDELKLARELA